MKKPSSTLLGLLLQVQIWAAISFSITKDLLNILLVLCMVTLELMSSRTSSHQFHSSISLDVTKFGAIGDGKTDDSQAFMKAWNATCGGDNALLEIPADKIFLISNPVTFKGPCSSSSITVQINGKIIAPSQISYWSGTKKEWISFYYVEGLTVTGNGIIDGQGEEWWEACHNKDSECGDRPTALKFSHCDNLKLSGLKHQNSQRNHISINRCNGATISDVTIYAPQTSPNTDGIDISSSMNVLIQHSNIATGDDCIAIGNGCSYINITDVFCGPGHGISVGSLGYHGEQSAVEEIHVYNCTFQGTKNGARIKTWQGGSGYARKISFDQIYLIGADNPIIIDQYYFDHSRQNKSFLSSSSSAVEISEISYTNFNGTSRRKEAIELKCSENAACDDIVLEHIHISSGNLHDKTYASCINARVTSYDTTPNLDCSSAH